MTSLCCSFLFLSFLLFVFIMSDLLWHQAEDVMGSILKEYLNVPNKKEEVSLVSDTNGNCGSDDQDNNANVDKLNSNSLCEGNGDVKNVAQSTENNLEELEGSEEKNGMIQTPEGQFKNVVAIVDPPRVGLHPVVSCMSTVTFVFNTLAVDFILRFRF